MARRDEPEPRVRGRSRSRGSGGGGGRSLSPDHYFSRSRQPLAALVFLLPLIVAYELGAFLYLGPEIGTDVKARFYLMKVLQFMGAAADYIIGPLVIAVLLAMHVMVRDRWRFEPRLYGAMLIESIALAIPALMFSLLVGQQETAQAVTASTSVPYTAHLVISVGAGIYEELVFRLILIAAVHALVVDVLKSNAQWGALIAVFASATLFALYHFGGASVPGGRMFTWPLFIYYSLLGFYFAILYIVRGFGIVVAVHALFDVMVVTLLHGVVKVQ